MLVTHCIDYLIWCLADYLYVDSSADRATPIFFLFCTSILYIFVSLMVLKQTTFYILYLFYLKNYHVNYHQIVYYVLLAEYYAYAIIYLQQQINSRTIYLCALI